MQDDDTVFSARMRSLARLARPTAHEVRGALNALTMHLELLAGSLDAGAPAVRERQGRHVAVLRAQCARLQHLTDAFLALAALPDTPADADTAVTVTGAVEAVRPLAATRHVRLEATPVTSQKCTGPALESWRQRLLDALCEAIVAADSGSEVHVEPAPGGRSIRVRGADGSCADVPLPTEANGPDA